MSAPGSTVANLTTPLLPAAAVPVIWTVLGYPFPAGSMVVGLGAALLVRAFRTLKEKSPQIRAVDIVVTAIVMLTTAVWVITRQPDLVAALGSGIGLEVAGEGIITRGPAVWEAMTTKGPSALLPPTPSAPPADPVLVDMTVKPGEIDDPG